MTDFMHVSEGQERYHYIDCGLDNVWLIGGVERMETPYGPATSIHDLDELHYAIAMDIISSKKMKGAEFRFLRMELELSQKGLAEILRATEQQIHRWENDKCEIPGPAQVALSSYYLESMDEGSRMKDLLDRYAELDNLIDGNGERLFSLNNDHWESSGDPVAA